MSNTLQENFWQSTFGQMYTDRNNYNPEQLDVFYKNTYGVTRSALNDTFLRNLKISTILEVGSNVGNQLRLLQKQGYTNLYGIEILDYAVEKAKQLTRGINIIKGSVFDLPFRDNYFDLVFTAGVLIHIHPDDLKKALQEICRVSRQYIWGFEYFAETYEPIKYRGNIDKLWKAPFAKMYLKTFPDIKLIKTENYHYLDNPNNADMMFLLEKFSL